MKLLLFYLFLTFTLFLNGQNLTQLIGTWKVDGKMQFEKWEEINGQYVGYGYVLDGKDTIILESLKIRFKPLKTIYEATVPNQNEGKSVQFVLNKSESEWFSFENLSHDFPNKIRYRFLNLDRMEVSVVDEINKGFAMSFSRIK